MNKLLERTLPLLAVLAVAVLLVLGGWKWRDMAADAELAALQSAQATAAAKAEAAYADALAQARADEQAANRRAAAISAAAAAQHDKSRAKVRQMQKGIDDAIKQDGSGCVDGLGANSLRHYRQSLGYPD